MKHITITSVSALYNTRSPEQSHIGVTIWLMNDEGRRSVPLIVWMSCPFRHVVTLVQFLVYWNTNSTYADFNILALHLSRGILVTMLAAVSKDVLLARCQLMRNTTV
jgi:hypothetical protein